MDKDSLTSVIPILYVKDLESEAEFYLSLGFIYTFPPDEKEFPGFIAFGNNNFEFGLERKADFDPDKAKRSFVWQMKVRTFEEVIKLCKEKGYKYTEPKMYFEKMNG